MSEKHSTLIVWYDSSVMIPSVEKLCAVSLRSEGESVKKIAKTLGVSVSSASIWVRDVSISAEQKTRLKMSGADRRKKALAVLSEKYRIQHENVDNFAREKFEVFFKNPSFMLGLGLYWADGTKSYHNSGVGFTNTDKYTIKIMLKWFKKYLGSRDKDLAAYLHIHIGHSLREEEIQKYWKNQLEIPELIFRKTWWVNAPWKKQYENDDNYHGTLTIRLLKSKDKLRMIRVWINCLKNDKKAVALFEK